MAQELERRMGEDDDQDPALKQLRIARRTAVESGENVILPFGDHHSLTLTAGGAMVFMSAQPADGRKRDRTGPRREKPQEQPVRTRAWLVGDYVAWEAHGEHREGEIRSMLAAHVTVLLEVAPDRPELVGGKMGVLCEDPTLRLAERPTAAPRLDVGCPKCHSPKGVPCANVHGRVIRGLHPERVPAAEAAPAEAEPAADPKEEGGKSMRGQLWQECCVRGCHNEPVCVDCERCQARHCNCPTPDEEAAERAERAAKAQAKRAAIQAARTALLERLAEPGWDPCSIPIERKLGVTGTFGEETWVTEDEPARIALFLDHILKREPWYAPRVKREPLTTREDVIRHLATTGKALNWDDEWYAEIRVKLDEGEGVE